MTIKASDTRPFLHLGATKTGSSFIQQKILGRAEGAVYLHAEVEQLTRAMRENLEVADLGRPLPSDRKVILSHEVLHGRPPEKMAPLLHRTFGDANILMVTRAPAKWLQSFYFQRIRNGEDREPSVWLAEDFKGLSGQLNFNHLHAEYSRAFGAENVYFLPYEMLAAAPGVFLDHLQKIAGLTFDSESFNMSIINRSATTAQMNNMRLANLFLNRLGRRNKDLVKKATEFRNAAVRILTERAPEQRPDDPRPEDLFPAELLAPLYANLDCLNNYPWYQDYAETYRLPKLA